MADSFDQAFEELGIDPTWQDHAPYGPGGVGGGNPPPYLAKQPGVRIDEAQPVAQAGPAGTREGRTPSGDQGGRWQPGMDPKLFVDQNIRQTQGRAADQSDYDYWLPKFQEVGGLGTGDYWLHKMTDPSGTGVNSGGGGGGASGGPPPPSGFTSQYTPIAAPDPFVYKPNTGTPFSYGASVPTAPTLQAERFATPTPFTGDRQATPAPLTYDRLATPTPFANGPAFTGDRQSTPTAYGYQEFQAPDEFKAPTRADLEGDTSYNYQLEQQQRAIEHSAAARGTQRSSNTLLDLMDNARGMASAEYDKLYGRKFNEYQTDYGNRFAENQAGNQGRLAEHTTNTGDQFRVSDTNYGRSATEAQQARDNAFGAYGANAQTGLAYGTANNDASFRTGQANISNAAAANADNYQRGATEADRNFSQQFTTTQGNNNNLLAFGQANFGNALAAQGQGYQQAANTYGVNQGAQAQDFGQQLGAYTTNTGNLLNFGNANNANALGWGNLGLGYQNSANSYALGQGNLDLNRQGQQFNQDLSTFNTNYQTQVMNPWNMNMQLYQAGNPGAPNYQGYGSQVGKTYEDQGNVNAASTLAQQKAWNDFYSGVTQNLQTMANQNPSTRGGYTPGSGQPLYR